ncbi:hypothetical protein JGY91_13410 [Staphylococcus xylosus]|jgi:hypothetical protein|uniref:hypothetical protein n=1 Tax=Staphylococcus xylosus TaxID=1288 RepID=UPI001CDD3C14|nr:hypothetical protein [Staphylococcus xylosus]MCA2501293.1 hypothetical protein [Staphylococcus xylosus]MCQ3817907.1 hypothetical protein [Staphylococcus xylosus]MCQ3820624.1 hypothetical protein [Staphylococcus xylosus]
MSKTAVLNLLVFILLIILALAFVTNIFGKLTIYIIIILPIIMLVLGVYSLVINVKKYNNSNNYINNNKFK